MNQITSITTYQHIVSPIIIKLIRINKLGQLAEREIDCYDTNHTPIFLSQWLAVGCDCLLNIDFSIRIFDERINPA